jgi:glycosidase
LANNALTVDKFAEKVEGLLSYYPIENVYAMYIPLGSHDTERIINRLGNDLGKTKLAALFQFAYPGAPAIYYGDEIGLTGGKDPGCRGAFPWDSIQWNIELQSYIKKLVEIRKGHLALRRGTYTRIKNINNPSCYAFIRRSENDDILVVMNASASEQHLLLNANECGWEDSRGINNILDSGKEYKISNGIIEISLPAWGGLWLA